MLRALSVRIKNRAVQVTLAGALALGTSMPAAPVWADNLADALVGAYKTSGLLQQNRALLRAADEDVAIAVSALRPILDWTGRFTRTYTDSVTGLIRTDTQTTDAFFGLTASLLLYDGGNTRLGVKAAQETVLATRQTLLNVEQAILLRAVVAYMNVLSTTELVRLSENNVRVLGEELRAAQDRFEVGEVTRTDVALAESRRASARTALAQARGNLTNAQEEYFAAVGRKAHPLSPNPRLPKAPASSEAARAVAMRNHPDILAAQHQVAAAELNIQRADAQLGPTASLNGSIGLTNTLNSDNKRDTASLSLTLNQRLYQGGGRAAGVRRAMASRDALRANLLTVMENVGQDVANAYVGLQVAEASLAASETNIRAARIAFDGIREEAKLGARTTLDVLDAEQELLDARADRITAQATRYIAAYQLLSAQGLLTAERLKLNVPIYDPEAYYNQVKNAPARYSKQGKELDRVLRSIGKK